MAVRRGFKPGTKVEQPTMGLNRFKIEIGEVKHISILSTDPNMVLEAETHFIEGIRPIQCMRENPSEKAFCCEIAEKAPGYKIIMPILVYNTITDKGRHSYSANKTEFMYLGLSRQGYNRLIDELIEEGYIPVDADEDTIQDVVSKELTKIDLKVTGEAVGGSGKKNKQYGNAGQPKFRITKNSMKGGPAYMKSTELRNKVKSWLCEEYDAKIEDSLGARVETREELEAMIAKHREEEGDNKKVEDENLVEEELPMIIDDGEEDTLPDIEDLDDLEIVDSVDEIEDIDTLLS